MQQRAPSAYTKQAYEYVYRLPQGQTNEDSIQIERSERWSCSMPNLSLFALERKHIADHVPRSQDASAENILRSTLHSCIHDDTCVHGEEGRPTILSFEPFGLPI